MSKYYDGPLEELTELTGVMYLSDLKTTNYELIRRELGNIDPDKYTLTQWEDVAQYLTGNVPNVETTEDLYDYLLTYKD